MKTPTAKLGSFAMWWNRYIDPITVESFVWRGYLHAICFDPTYSYPWRLIDVGKDKYGRWGSGSAAYVSREALESAMQRMGMQWEVQVELEL